MAFDFINPWMLAGLAGVALPVLAHLLSRRKFDVVNWGAMQFLELGRNARRRIRLEEFLLLLVRMLLVGLIVFGLSRPWASGGMFANFLSTQSRDVVFVVDSSYSMGWEGKTETPHATAIQWIHDFLEELRAGDTISILDARDVVRPVIESPSTDFAYVREQLDKLPPPSGTANLAEATAKAVQILSRTSHVAREVIVLTDGQSLGWMPDDDNLWIRFDDLRNQPSVKPRIWSINVAGPWESQVTNSTRVNYAVDRLQTSRERTVRNFPVRIQTKVRATGGEAGTHRRVHFEVDGQRLAEKSIQVFLEPGGEASVEFEHRFANVGSHLVSVILDKDNLPGDDRADVAISVAEAVSVLIVDGDPQLDRTRSESFFAQAAFNATLNDAPWVNARVVPIDEFDADDLADVEVALCANAPRFSESQKTALQDFVAGGGGVWFSLGDLVDAADYNRMLFAEGHGLLGASLESIVNRNNDDTLESRVSDGSLDFPWLTRFRAADGGTLSEGRIANWWKVAPVEQDDLKDAKPPTPGEAFRTPEDKKMEDVELGPAIVAMRLETGDPVLVTRRYGRGQTALLTTSIDAEWNTLPAKTDFVPLLHEIIFHLASSSAVRNVDVGTPLLLPVTADFPVNDYVFRGPNETEFKPQLGGDELRPIVRLADTSLSGVYTFEPKDQDAATPKNAKTPQRPETFVVNFDRNESNLTELTEEQRTHLKADERMSFVDTRQELREQMFVDESRTEFWPLLLFIFLGFLVFEVVMTRRLVQGGHEDLEQTQAERAAKTGQHHPAVTT